MQVVWNNKKSTGALKEAQKMEIKDLTKYINRELFIPNLAATKKDEALEELAELFQKTRMVRNKELFLEMLHRRETLGSTGIGKGVAVPHGRTTAVMDVSIAFGRSEEGIEFEAVDNKPVHLIFLVVAPPHDENNMYLPVLGKLVEVVNDKSTRKQLMRVETYEDFLNVFTEG